MTSDQPLKTSYFPPTKLKPYQLCLNSVCTTVQMTTEVFNVTIADADMGRMMPLHYLLTLFPYVIWYKYFDYKLHTFERNQIVQTTLNVWQKIPFITKSWCYFRSGFVNAMINYSELIIWRLASALYMTNTIIRKKPFYFINVLYSMVESNLDNRMLDVMSFNADNYNHIFISKINTS